MLSFNVWEYGRTDTVIRLSDGVRCVPAIVIIEPADFETSFPVTEPTDLEDGEHYVAGFGAMRMRAMADGDQNVPWTKAYGPVRTFSAWHRNAVNRVSLLMRAHAYHAPRGYSTPYGRHI